MRRAGLTLAVLVACVAVVATSAGPALATDWTQAPTLPNPAFVDNGSGGYTLSPAARTLLRNGNYYGSFQAPDGSVDTAAYQYVDKARVAGRFFPSWATTLRGLSAGAGQILLFYGASVAYQDALRMQIPGQGYIYRLIAGETYASDPSTAAPLAWNDIESGSLASWHSGGALPLGWYLGTAASKTNELVVCDTPGVSGCTSSANIITGSLFAQQLAAGSSASYDHATATTPGCTPTPFTVCSLLFRTDAQMDAALKVKPTDEASYTALGSARKHDIGTYTQPTPTSADDQAAADALGVNSSTPTTDQKTAINKIAHDVDPTYPTTTTTTAPIVLPKPELNESVQEWLDRLRALGWSGAATVTTYDGDLVTTGAQPSPNAGPGAPIVITTTAATVDLSSGLSAWPDNPPQVTPSEAIAVERNPTTYPGGAPVPDVAAGVTCNCPPIDFGPLTGLDLGDKFPFGIFGYLTTVLGWFDVEPVPPGFDIDVSAHGTSAHAIENPGHYTGDLEAFSPYMVIVRALMTVALWVGAVWLVATRLLGFNAGGDMTEAVDDGSVL